jgi:hypothetical protein
MNPAQRKAYLESIVQMGRSIGFTEASHAKLGYGDGSGRIVENQTLRRAYIHYGDKGSETDPRGVAYFPSWDCGIPFEDSKINEGLDIELRKPPDGGVPEIFRIHPTGIQAKGGRTGSEEKLDIALQPSIAQLGILRPSGVGTDAIIDEIYPYRHPFTGRAKIAVNPSLALAADIAALTAGQHQVAYVYFDPTRTSNQLQRVLTSAATASFTLPSVASRGEFGASTIYSLMNSVPAFCYDIGAVYLYYGQTSIAEADWYRKYNSRRVINEPLEAMARLTTSDATTTDVIAFALSELQAVTLTGRFLGTKSDYSAAIGGTFRGTWRRASGGNVTMIGLGTVTSEEDSSGTPAVTLAADTTNQTGDVRVTGIAAETWTWVLWYQAVLISSAA